MLGSQKHFILTWKVEGGHPFTILGLGESQGQV